MVKIIIVLVLAVVQAQWAYLGGSKDGSNQGKTSGMSLWPSPRFGAGFSYKNNQLFLFGGSSADNLQNDLWLLDLITMSWKRLGPLDSSFVGGSLVDKGKFSYLNWPEQVFCITMFNVNDYLYLFPSSDIHPDYYPNYYIYSISSRLWYFNRIENDLHIQFKDQPNAYSSYFDFESRSFYLFGPEEHILIANMTTLELSVDVIRKSKYLSGYSSSASDLEQKKIFLFGGQLYNSSYHNHVFCHDIELGTEEQLDLLNVSERITPQQNSHGLSGIYSDSYFPSIRAVASFCLDSKNDRFILFGGFDPFSRLGFSDLWLFDINLRNWAYISGTTTPGSSSKFGKKGVPSVNNYPSQRFRNVFFYDEEQEIFYIFGGSYFDGRRQYDLNDCWAYYFQYKQPSLTVSTINYQNTKDFNNSITGALVFNKSENYTGNPYVKYVLICISSLLIAIIIAFAILRFRFSWKKLHKPQQDSNNIQTSVTKLAAKVMSEIEGTAFSNYLLETLSIPAFKECNVKDFEISQYLTRGGMGRICLAKGLKEEFMNQGNSDNLIVVKLIGDLESNPPAELYSAFIQEVAIMEMLSHFPNIVKLLGFCHKPMCIVMKYYMNGSLSSLLRSSVTFSVKRIAEIIQDVSKGLTVIHDHDIVHCDIKSDNVLVEYDEIMCRFVCFITDFGICRIISSKSLKVHYFQVSDIKGFSYNYAAPELFHRKTHSEAKSRDIYSLAVLMGEVLTRRKPWN